MLTHVRSGLQELASAPRQRPFEPQSFAIYSVAGLVSVLLVGAFLLTPFSYDNSPNKVFAALAVFIVGAMTLRYLALIRIAGTIEVIALKMFISGMAAMGSSLIASTAFPLADEALIKWDAMLGFDWVSFMAWLSDKPGFVAFLDWCYSSITWQLFILVPALFFFRQDRRCWTFLLAWALALAITLAIFPFFPAVGPIVHHGISATGIPVQDGFLDVFLGVRDGTVRELGLTTVRGMITLPSFHAASGVMLGWAAARLPYIGWPLVALNVVMTLSATPIGGHYLVDILAGILVAAVAIQAAKMVQAGIVGSPQVSAGGAYDTLFSSGPPLAWSSSPNPPSRDGPDLG